MAKPSSKPIQAYLPIKSKEHTLVQGRVPAGVASDAKAIMARKNLSWANVLTACLRQFVDDHAASRARAR